MKKIYGVEVSGRRYRYELLDLTLKALAYLALMTAVCLTDFHITFKSVVLIAIASFAYTSYWCAREDLREAARRSKK